MSKRRRSGPTPKRKPWQPLQQAGVNLAGLRETRRNVMDAEEGKQQMREYGVTGPTKARQRAWQPGIPTGKGFETLPDDWQAPGLRETG